MFLTTLPRRFLTGLILILGLPIAACAPGSTPRDRIEHDDRYPLRFGVHPFVDPALLHRAFAPLAAHLSARLDRPVTLVIANSLEHLGELCDQGVVDIGWTSPRDEDPGAALEVLCWPRAANPEDYRLALVVTATSVIRDLASLRGSRLGVVDHRSWNGSTELAALMAEQGLSLSTHFRQIDAVGNHEEVLHRLEEGRCDVGAVLELALRTGGSEAPAAEAIPSRPHVISVTKPLSLEPICVSPGMAKEIREKLRLGLLGLEADPAGKSALEALRRHLSLTGFAERPG